MSDYTQTLVTDSHHCVLNAGGLILIELEEIENEDEEVTPDFLAGHDESRFLSPSEALEIAAFVEQNRAYLEKKAGELDRYFTKVAQAWLDEFRPSAMSLSERQVYWWPEIRNEADHCLIRLTNAETNPVLTAWKEQTRQNEDFPRSQQEALLLRYFKKLYYEKYPIPDVTTDQDEGNEQAN
jgi:hypothetical protein